MFGYLHDAFRIADACIMECRRLHVGFTSGARRNTFKRRFLHNLLRFAHVVSLRQVRHTEDDVLMLPGSRHYFFSLWHAGPSGLTKLSGGVVVAVDLRLLRAASSVSAWVVARGRALAVDSCFGGRWMAITRGAPQSRAVVG